MFENFIIGIQAKMAMKAKIGEARSLFKKDGKRRFIIPFRDGTMGVITKDEALALKAANELPIDLTAKTLYNACFFYTETSSAHSKVKCEMPEHERERRYKFYKNWFIKHHTK